MSASSDDPRFDETRSQTVRSGLPRIEFGRNQSKDFRYYLTVFCTAIASWIVWLLPFEFVKEVAIQVGRITYHLSPGFRRNAESNMSHVVDLPPDDPTVTELVKSIFRTNAINAVELLESPHLSADQLSKKLTIDTGSWDILDKALASGQGAVLLTAHLGPFDTVGAVLASRGYPLTVLTARTTNRYAFDAVTFLRRSHNMRVHQATSSGVREVIKALHRGEFVVLLSDRDFFLSGASVEFFGETTTLPVGAVRLARDAESPIIPMFTRRTKAGPVLDLFEPYTVPKTDDRLQDLIIGMEKMSRALETGIGRAPGQWALFQRVWPGDELVTPAPTSSSAIESGSAHKS